MDFSIIDEKLIEERFASLPNELKGVLESEEAQQEIINLSKTHFLDEEKAQILQQLVSLTLLGFVSPADLIYEFKEKLFLNHDHARALSKELDDLLFGQLKEELRDVYNPIARADMERRREEEMATNDVLPIVMNTLPVQAEDRVEESTPVSIDAVDEGPKVIQKEASFFERATPTPGNKINNLSFNSFASSSETSGAKPIITAKVETPQAAPSFPPPIQPLTPRKVVDYTEMKPPTPHTEISSEFVNLGALQKVSTTPSTPASIPTPNTIPVPNITPITQSTFKSGITSEFSRLSSLAPKSGEKKSPAQWIPTPMSITPNPEPVKEPIASIKEPVKTIEPKHIDAIIMNPSLPSSSTQTSSPSNSPALDGNVIHLRY